MENNNFNGEKISQNNENENINPNKGIRSIDVPRRTYLQENKFKEIDLRKNKKSF
jgi:hypothetical protein